MRRRPPSPAAKCDGFSLVEVAFAVGIIAVAVTALLGTWPVGQAHMRRAVDSTIAAQVAQRLVAEVQQADFPDVLRLAGLTGGAPSGSLERRYFSQTGREVDAANAERMYEVITRVSHREQLPVAGGAKRWDAHGQLVVTIDVAVSHLGQRVPVNAEGLVDRARYRRPVFTFPFVIGGNAAW